MGQIEKIEHWDDPVADKEEKREEEALNEEIAALKSKAETVKNKIDELIQHLVKSGNNKKEFIEIVNILQEEMGKLNYDINMARRNNNGK